MTNVWDSGNASSHITLSGANLTATAGGPGVPNSQGEVRSTPVITSGGGDFWYAEIYATNTYSASPPSSYPWSNSPNRIGIFESAEPISNSAIPGNGPNSWVVAIGGTIQFAVHNSTNAAILNQTANSSVTIMLAVDTNSNQLWLGIDGTWFTGDPGTLTSPTWTSVTGSLYFGAELISPPSGPGQSSPYEAYATLNAGGSPFAYSIPHGFGTLDHSSSVTGTTAQTLSVLRQTIAGKDGALSRRYNSWRNK
jgi:hypothetical protein